MGRKATGRHRQATQRLAHGVAVAVSLTAFACVHGDRVATPPEAEEVTRMHTKLDPNLAELVERAESGRGDAAATVDVLVGLSTPLDAAIRADLATRGLRTRSEIGTVLTGSMLLRDVRRLADSPHVVKLEASTPLYREPADPGE